MKCPVCYIARFPLLASAVVLCLLCITWDSFAALGRTFLKEIGSLYDEVCYAGKRVLRGESFL